MIYVVSWSRTDIKFDRDVSRSEFESVYWGANRVNFDPVQMPQRQVGRFTGTVAILEVIEDCEYQTCPFLGPWELCGAVDALHFGKMFPEVVREHRAILATGSLGPTTGPACEVLRYCPTLFVHTNEPEASVFFGVERIEIKHGSLTIPKGSKILVAKKS